MRTITRAAVSCVVSAIFLCPSVALPEDLSALDPEPAPAATDDLRAIEPAPVNDTADDELGSLVSEASLAEARGGADLHVSENNLDATLEGNVASNLSTGNNTITESAFSNTSGIPMVIQNSGNNVIIQNSTILNLDLR